jgi:hypothetical protein
MLGSTSSEVMRVPESVLGHIVPQISCSLLRLSFIHGISLFQYIYFQANGTDSIYQIKLRLTRPDEWIMLVLFNDRSGVMTVQRG